MQGPCWLCCCVDGCRHKMQCRFRFPLTLRRQSRHTFLVNGLNMRYASCRVAQGGVAVQQQIKTRSKRDSRCLRRHGFRVLLTEQRSFNARDLSGEQQQQSSGSPNHYSATDRMRAQLSLGSRASVMVTGREGAQVAAEESSKFCF